MRRILWMAAVAVLVLAVAAPAMALDFKFGGLAQTHFYDHTGIGFDKSSYTNPGNNMRGADLFFRARFDASDDNGNVTSVIRLRIGKIVYGAGGGTENPIQFPSMAPVSTFNGVGFGKLGFSSGGGLGTRGTNIETEWAYLDFAMPFNIPLRIRAGLQPIYFPKGMLIDDNAAGVRAYGTMAPVSYELQWWRFDAGNDFGLGSTTASTANGGGTGIYEKSIIGIAGRYRPDFSDNNYDVYGLKIDYALAPQWNPGLYFLYGDNRVNCSGTNTVNTPCPNQNRVRPNWYFGWTNTGKVGVVSWDFDFIYGWAKGGANGNFVPGTINTSIDGNNNLPPITVRGFALDAGVHFPVGPVMIHFGGSYGSGDDQKLDSPAFPGGYSPGWQGPVGGMEFIGSGGGSGFGMITHTQNSLTNLWTVGGYATYNPVKALTLKVAWGFAGFSRKAGNCAYAATKNLGCYGPTYFGAGFTSTPGALGGATLLSSSGPGTQDGVATGATAATVVQGTGGLAGKGTLGQEFDLQAFYNVWTNFNINGMVGWFFPTAGDTAGKYVLTFNYAF